MERIDGTTRLSRSLRAAALIAAAGCLHGGATASANESAHAAIPVGALAMVTLDPVPSYDFLRRVRSIADWVIENSIYERYQRLPAFVRLPDDTLNYVFYSQTEAGYFGQDDVVALYTPHIILLSESFDMAAHEHRIVHEMVHHLQFESGRTFDCPIEGEREAYEIQAKWTKATGKGTPPNSMMLIRMRCDGPHP